MGFWQLRKTSPLYSSTAHTTPMNLGRCVKQVQTEYDDLQILFNISSIHNKDEVPNVQTDKPYC